MKTQAFYRTDITRNSFNPHRALILLIVVLVFTGCLKSIKPFYKIDQLVDASTYYGVYERNGAWWVFLPFEGIEAGNGNEDSIFGTSDASVEFDISENSKGLDAAIQKMSLFTVLDDSIKAMQLYTMYLKGEDEINEDQVMDGENAFEPEEEKFYIAAFFELDGVILADITPYELFGNNSFAGRHHVPVHSLSKVLQDEENQSLAFHFVSDSKLGQMLKEDKIRIKHEQIISISELEEDESSNFLLTAETDELQSFITKFILKDDSFFGSGVSNSKIRLNKVF